MISGSVVFYKIATTCLLIFVGFIARRMKLLPENSTAVLSKLVFSIALPCFMIYNMPTYVTREGLTQYWFFPLLGAFLLVECDLLAYVSDRLWAGPGEHGTFRILVGFSNWMFMAVAVCEPLFPEDGLRVILLNNIGMLLYFWSFGMSSFRAGIGFWGVARQLFGNQQLLCIVIGLLLAVFVPSLRGLEKLPSAELAALPWYLGVLTPIWETVYLIGSTALPLSIVQIGLLLGAPRDPAVRPAVGNRSLVVSSFLRLIAAPALSIATLAVLCRLGVPLTSNEFVISIIMMAMPGAILILTITEVYGGAVHLAARGILWTTIASLLTAPLLTLAAQYAYLWTMLP
jgi:predicted permease